MHDRPSRTQFFVCAMIVMLLGLASRYERFSLPTFVTQYAGDTLWALMAYLLIGFVAPRMSWMRRGVCSLAFAYTIELSQLYHAPWIDSIRGTSLGGLVLGYGVVWTDFICYLVGIAFGMFMEWLATKMKAKANARSKT